MDECMQVENTCADPQTNVHMTQQKGHNYKFVCILFDKYVLVDIQLIPVHRLEWY